MSSNRALFFSLKYAWTYNIYACEHIYALGGDEKITLEIKRSFDKQMNENNKGESRMILPDSRNPHVSIHLKGHMSYYILLHQV